MYDSSGWKCLYGFKCLKSAKQWCLPYSQARICQKASLLKHLKVKSKHHDHINAPNCFWMQFAGAVLLNMLCKYAQRRMELGRKMQKNVWRGKKQQRRTRSDLFTPQPLRARLETIKSAIQHIVERKGQTALVCVGLIMIIWCPHLLCICVNVFHEAVFLGNKDV